MSGNATYTGRREIFEEKFTYFVPFFETINIDVPNVTINPNTGTFQQQVMKTKLFNEVFYEKPREQYGVNDDNNNIYDRDLLKINFIEELKFTTSNPYKFIKKITMEIDTISFQTYSNYLSGGASRDNEGYKQLTSMLPIQVVINNKEIEFTSKDGITEFTMDEYGLYGPTGKTITTDEIPTGQPPPVKRYKGNLYVQSYDKTFELSSVPSKIQVSLNLNDNIYTEYRKTEFYRQNPEVLNSGEILTVEKNFFYNSFINSFRIDGRIIQTIDYESLDMQSLDKPSRIIKEDPNTTIINLLKQFVEKSVSQKHKEKKKKAPELVLDKITPDEAENIALQIIDPHLDRNVVPENYIDVVTNLNTLF